MHDFAYHRATSIADAVTAMRDAQWGAYLGGGMTLIPRLKQRLSSPSTLIDIGRLDGLRAIDVDGGIVEIGALATHAAVATSAAVTAAIPALARLAGDIGDPQVRNRGTLGGALAGNDPAADYPAATLALDAAIVTDRRVIAACAFFRGPFETALAADELITAVRFPVPLQAGYARFNRGTSRYAVAGVFVARSRDGVRVAVTGAGPCVFRHHAMEERLSADFAPAALDGIHLAARGLNDDHLAGARYRAHLVPIMARRAVALATAG